MATFVVDLPTKFAGIKVGPTLFIRDSKDEIEVILICERARFQVVLTDELDSKVPRQPGGDRPPG